MLRSGANRGRESPLSFSPLSFSGLRPAWTAAIPGALSALALALAALALGAQQSLLPPAVIAVLLGMTAGPWLPYERLAGGIKLCTGIFLRSAVALLGLRLSLIDVADVGVGRLLALIAIMVFTVLTCRALAERLGLSRGDGLVIGAANAVCGAAAAFAMAAAVPEREREKRILLLTVVLANALSTLAMVLYPALAELVGFTPHQTGAMVGAAMQDMAQVVATMTPLPEEAAKAGITVKMMRVLLLLPVVLIFTRSFKEPGEAPAVPRFALFFVGFCMLNTWLQAMPSFAPHYGPVRAFLLQLSGVLLLVALAAMGMGTSLRGVLACGWRPLAVFGTGAVTILAGAMLLARWT